MLERVYRAITASGPSERTIVGMIQSTGVSQPPVDGITLSPSTKTMMKMIAITKFGIETPIIATSVQR